MLTSHGSMFSQQMIFFIIRPKKVCFQKNIVSLLQMAKKKSLVSQEILFYFIIQAIMFMTLFKKKKL